MYIFRAEVAMLGSGRIYMGLEEAKAMEMDQSETWNEVGGDDPGQ